MSAQSEVKVYVRTRPTVHFAQELVEFLPDKKTIRVRQRKDYRIRRVINQISSWSFQVNGVLHNTSQEEVYQHVAQSVVLGALDGYNGTIMCYGQTGAGKSYTLTGAIDSYQKRGIIPRAIQQVFHEIQSRVDHTFSVQLSFLEIYNETLVDLLSSVNGGRVTQAGNLTVVDEPAGGVSVKGLSLHSVYSEDEALKLFFEGEMNKRTEVHPLNKNSSRSHCIFTIYIESHSCVLSNVTYTTTKLNLVDLAASEMLSKSGSEGRLQREAVYINTSLSFLEQAILALAEPHREHVPFRQSKLTHALKDSLGGNCNTVLVANVYGEAAHIDETLSTLRFAARMKCVRTELSINKRINPHLQVLKLQKEIQLLKQELFFHDIMTNQTRSMYEDLSETQVEMVKSQVHRYLAGTLDEIAIVSIRQIREVFARFKNAVLKEEQRVREQICQEYTLVKKTQRMPTSSAVSKPGGAIEEVKDTRFGLAVTSSSPSSSQSPSKSKGKKGKESSRKDGGSLYPAMQPVVTQRETESDGIEGQHTTTEKAEERNVTPPPNAEAFEMFKAERGSEINRVLKENKTVLQARLAQLHNLVETINSTKRDIDRMSSELQLCREQRQSQGRFLSEDGEPVLEETEVNLHIKLRQMKTEYRQMYEELLSTKSQVQYCRDMVDQCRKRLLTDFEKWYNESFLSQVEFQPLILNVEEVVPVDRASTLERLEQDHFEHLYTGLAEDDLSAMTFYNMHKRAAQRRTSTPVPVSPKKRSIKSGTNKLTMVNGRRC
ncbi:kinesin-like protein KIF9 isoform X2 [Trichomycterus rosablanca]|uniref:kinesin-like protein KIF9 isoform X2 n=1 Tax=Trichomycterus rosablanca TaxID=2290929 RepID=UPI002F358801